MKKRWIVSACVILISQVGVFAQNENARVTAMGNTDVVSDIGRILLYNPVYMNDYKNKAQVTFNTPMLGVKSFGNMFSAGLGLNNGLEMKGFYAAALALLPQIAPAATQPQYFPHVLLGFDLSSIKLGFDVFTEYSRFTSDNTVTTTTASTETVVAETILDPGVIAGAHFGPDALSIDVTLGIGMPNAWGTATVNGVVDTATKMQTETGLFLKAGGELGIGSGDPRFTFGLNLGYESFQFSTHNATVKGNKYKYFNLVPYAAYQTKFLTDALFIAMLKANMIFDSQDNNTSTNPTSSDTLLYTLSIGAEKQFKSVWVFDSVAIRGGLAYQLRNSFASTELDGTGTSNITKTGNVTTIGPAVPYMGAGISKGAFNFDMVINPAVWTGLFMGPPVVKATATLTF